MRAGRSPRGRWPAISCSAPLDRLHRQHVRPRALDAARDRAAVEDDGEPVPARRRARCRHRSPSGRPSPTAGSRPSRPRPPRTPSARTDARAARDRWQRVPRRPEHEPHAPCRRRSGRSRELESGSQPASSSTYCQPRAAAARTYARWRARSPGLSGSDHHDQATRPGWIHDVSRMRDGRPSDSARSEPTTSARSPTIATRHGVVAGAESPCGSVTARTPGRSLATVIRAAGLAREAALREQRPRAGAGVEQRREPVVAGLRRAQGDRLVAPLVVAAVGLQPRPCAASVRARRSTLAGAGLPERDAVTGGEHLEPPPAGEA